MKITINNNAATLTSALHAVRRYDEVNMNQNKGAQKERERKVLAKTIITTVIIGPNFPLNTNIVQYSETHCTLLLLLPYCH